MRDDAGIRQPQFRRRPFPGIASLAGLAMGSLVLLSCHQEGPLSHIFLLVSCGVGIFLLCHGGSHRKCFASTLKRLSSLMADMSKRLAAYSGDVAGGAGVGGDACSEQRPDVRRVNTHLNTDLQEQVHNDFVHLRIDPPCLQSDTAQRLATDIQYQTLDELASMNFDVKSMDSEAVNDLVRRIVKAKRLEATIDDGDVTAPITLLEDAHAAVRRQAAYSFNNLAFMATNTRPVEIDFAPYLKPLADRLVDRGHPDIRLNAVLALGNLLKSAPSNAASATHEACVLGIANLLEDDSADIRCAALQALSKVPQENRILHAEAVVKLLRDPIVKIKRQAVCLIGKMGEDCVSSHSQDVADLLDDQDAVVRLSAAQTIATSKFALLKHAAVFAKSCGDLEIDELSKLVCDTLMDDDLGISGQEALQSAAEAVAPSLVQQMMHGDDTLQHKATLVLSKFPFGVPVKAVATQLEMSLNDSDGGLFVERLLQTMVHLAQQGHKEVVAEFGAIYLECLGRRPNVDSLKTRRYVMCIFDKLDAYSEPHLGMLARIALGNLDDEAQVAAIDILERLFQQCQHIFSPETSNGKLACAVLSAALVDRLNGPRVHPQERAKLLRMMKALRTLTRMDEIPEEELHAASDSTSAGHTESDNISSIDLFSVDGCSFAGDEEDHQLDDCDSRSVASSKQPSTLRSGASNQGDAYMLSQNTTGQHYPFAIVATEVKKALSETSSTRASTSRKLVDQLAPCVLSSTEPMSVLHSTASEASRPSTLQSRRAGSAPEIPTGSNLLSPAVSRRVASSPEAIRASEKSISELARDVAAEEFPEQFASAVWNVPDSRFFKTVQQVAVAACQAHGSCAFVVAPKAALRSIQQHHNLTYEVADRDKRFPSGYMSQRLRNVRAKNPEFLQAVQDFSEEGYKDRWPEQHEAADLPKDGFFIIDDYGWCLKAATRLVGLPKAPIKWECVGMRHTTAISCAWVLRCHLSAVVVRSHHGIMYGLTVQDNNITVLRCRP